MHHLLAYSESTAAVANTDIDPVPDQVFLIQNAHFVPQNDVFLQAAYMSGLTIARGRIVTPALRQIALPYVRPVNLATNPVSRPPVLDLSQNPLRLKALEEIAVEISQTAAGPTVVTAGLFVGDRQPTPIPQGDVLSMRGTGTTTAVAEQWTLAAITWESSLPAGDYICAGLQVIGATCKLARMIFQGQDWRPGCVGTLINADLGSPVFRNGNLGVYGRFKSYAMPQIQILCSAADTAQEVYLDLVRVG